MQTTSLPLILLCIFLTLVVVVALYLQWREDQIKRSIQRDLDQRFQEYYDKHKLK